MDRDSEVCLTSSYALGRIGAPAVAPLLGVVRNRAAGIPVRRAAADALRMITPDSATLPGLKTALKELDKDVRLAGAKSGGREAKEAAETTLTSLFSQRAGA